MMGSLKALTECLSEGPKTLSEIVKASKMHRTTVVRSLGFLKESDLVIEEGAGRSKKFSLVPEYRTDTYFGLPLTEEAEKQASSIYHLIIKHWGSVHILAMIAISEKVIADCDELEIPYGWWAYGMSEVLIFDNSREYAYFGLPKKVENYVKKLVATFANNSEALVSYKLNSQPTEKNGRNLYAIKKEVLSVLKDYRLFYKNPKRVLKFLAEKAGKLKSFAPKTAGKDCLYLMDAYIYLMSELSNKLGNDALTYNDSEIRVKFYSLWEYVMMHYFKQSLFKLYPEKTLDRHFRPHIKREEYELIESLALLHLLIPEDKSENEFKKMFQSFLKKRRKEDDF